MVTAAKTCLAMSRGPRSTPSIVHFKLAMGEVVAAVEKTTGKCELAVAAATPQHARTLSCVSGSPESHHSSV